jgi:hypothetical protein
MHFSPCSLHAMPIILVDLMVLIIFGDKHKNGNPHYAVILRLLLLPPFLLRPNILCRAPLFSDTVDLCYSINVREQSFYVHTN